jgi:transposase-like protein
MFDREMIEQAAFMYLRALSFQSIVDILRSWFEKDIFSKRLLIDHIERLTDMIPEHREVSEWLHPVRSGFYALDGTWMKLHGQDFVLLILLDVVTLDVVSWTVADEENEESYTQLIAKAYDEISGSAKGFFCDGDPGLLKALRLVFPGVPIQLCVFHKYARTGQIIPFTRTRTPIDREIKARVERILFASTKEVAMEELVSLQRYALEHQEYDKLKKIVGVLKRNFDLLLTHYDNPEMSPYNNTLEGFNYLVKRKVRLMKGFKKVDNIHRWLKLILLDWRFHRLASSEFPNRRGRSPLELAGCELPKIRNWMTFIRQEYHSKTT